MDEFGAHIVAVLFLKRKKIFLYTLQELNKSFEKCWNLVPYNFQKNFWAPELWEPKFLLRTFKNTMENSLLIAPEFFLNPAPGGWWVLRSGLLNSFF